MSGCMSVTVPSYARASPQLSSGCASGMFQWQSSRRLVGVEAVVDDQRRPWPASPANFRSAGAVKTGFAAEDDEQLDLAGVHRRRRARAATRAGPIGVDFDRSAVGDRRADVAERLVHRVRERVHRGRLVFAGDDERAAAMRLQVLGDGGHPLRRVGVRERRRRRPRRRRRAARQTAARILRSPTPAAPAGDRPSRPSASACSRSRRAGSSSFRVVGRRRRAVGEVARVAHARRPARRKSASSVTTTSALSKW